MFKKPLGGGGVIPTPPFVQEGLNTANILENWLKNVSLCDLMTVFARFPKYWYSTFKSSSFTKI